MADSNQTAQICDAAVRAIAAGECDALGDIYDHLARHIYLAAYAITANHADAEDVLQDTMLQIVRYAPSYRPATNARAWILAMARHRAIDLVRARRAALRADEDALLDAPAPSDAFGYIEALSLLELLNTDERQLIIHRLLEELSYAEIAQIMGISIAAAQKRYQRALAKLQKSISNQERKS